MQQKVETTPKTKHTIFDVYLVNALNNKTAKLRRSYQFLNEFCFTETSNNVVHH